MALKRPVHRVIKLMNTYYEFDTGSTFIRTNTPIRYRFSEADLLAANQGVTRI
jgi:hypothetical protein